MKFSCTQENLNTALGIVGHVAHKNVNLPILQNIKIEAKEGGITLSTTNLEIGVEITVRGKIEQPGVFTLPAQLLSSYVSLLNSDDNIDCELNDKMFTITCGDHHTVIKGEEASEFPILPVIEKEAVTTIPANSLEVGLQRAVIAASVDETRPEIAGVLFHFNGNQLVLAATDSYRLSEVKLPLVQSAHEERKIILPQRSSQELLRIIQNVTADQVQIYISDNQFGCTVGDVQFVSRIIEGNFPDYAQIIPEVTSTTIKVPVADLVTAIKGAALFSKTGINDVRLTFVPDEGAIKINAANSQLGENTATVPVIIEGTATDIVFNYRYVLDGLQHMKHSIVQFQCNDGMSPGVFRPTEDSSFVYIVMPIKQ